MDRTISDIVDISCTTPGCHFEANDESQIRDLFECEGHADGPVMGETFYCDGSCKNGLSCPFCKIDESGLEITAVGDRRVRYNLEMTAPTGENISLTPRFPVMPEAALRFITVLHENPQEGVKIIGHPVDEVLVRIPDSKIEGYCKHGTYVGGIGIDWMCGRCEQGSNWADVNWVEVKCEWCGDGDRIEPDEGIHDLVGLRTLEGRELADRGLDEEAPMLLHENCLDDIFSTDDAEVLDRFEVRE